MTCTVCGLGTAKRVERKKYPARYSGEPVEVPTVEMFHCESCGEDFFTPEQAKAYSRAVKNEVRKRCGLLPPARIAAIREKLRLTQSDLEELLGQGPKVVVRWENGKVIQNRAADTFLRVLDREPDVLEHLRAIQKQRSRQRQHHSATARAHQAL